MDLPLYEKHEGTVLVSGATEPGKAARYALHLLSQPGVKVDILFIGANAGQQAYKVCSILAEMARESLGILLGFYPSRFATDTVKRDAVGNTVSKDGHEQHERKDAYVWRAFDATASRRGL